MPIYKLNNEIVFPPVELADSSGILAVGGDLSVPRLIEAYANGIFPWFSDDEPIVWWSPDPRFVLFPENLKVSKTMRQVLNRHIFEITFDRAFRDVVRGCQQKRKKQRGTWITPEMLEAYTVLHQEGLAHSVEAWRDGNLAGGLYGVSLGRCFFGESMFTRENNASKAAFLTLAKILFERGFHFIDCQVYTSHLDSLGATEIGRGEFIPLLRRALEHETLRGNWGTILA